jgi:hypothetical protein
MAPGYYNGRSRKAFYEYLWPPNGDSGVWDMNVTPADGHSVYAEVNYDPAYQAATFFVGDLTTGQSDYHVASGSNVVAAYNGSSAEWIDERLQQKSGAFQPPLANYGSNSWRTMRTVRNGTWKGAHNSIWYDVDMKWNGKTLAIGSGVSTSDTAFSYWRACI